MGPNVGRDGFAILPYEDFLLHATDVWATQLGVPLDVDLWATTPETADTTSGRQRGTQEIPLAEIRPYVVDVGNNGELSETGNYWTTEKDLERLFLETIPEKARTLGWSKKRVMLYLHGGLNGEAEAAKRAVAFRDRCLENGIYPLHIMWETGPLETISDILGDLFTTADERAGGALLDRLRSVKDRALELTASPIGGPIWTEMKENAWRASDHRDGKGAIQLMQKQARDSLGQVTEAERQAWELHVVAHSAGSILFAHAVEALCTLGIPFKTLQFFAPAIRIDEFEKYALPAIKAGRCPKATMYILSEEQEAEDTVGSLRPLAPLARVQRLRGRARHTDPRHEALPERPRRPTAVGVCRDHRVGGEESHGRRVHLRDARRLRQRRGDDERGFDAHLGQTTAAPVWSERSGLLTATHEPARFTRTRRGRVAATSLLENLCTGGFRARSASRRERKARSPTAYLNDTSRASRRRRSRMDRVSQPGATCAEVP